MKISVHVKPNARRNEVKQLDDGSYRVSVTAPPIKGKANNLLIEQLADYFGRPKRSIIIVRGASARAKVVEIEGI